MAKLVVSDNYFQDRDGNVVPFKTVALILSDCVTLTTLVDGNNDYIRMATSDVSVVKGRYVEWLNKTKN